MTPIVNVNCLEPSRRRGRKLGEPPAATDGSSRVFRLVVGNATGARGGRNVAVPHSVVGKVQRLTLEKPDLIGFLQTVVDELLRP